MVKYGLTVNNIVNYTNSLYFSGFRIVFLKTVTFYITCFILIYDIPLLVNSPFYISVVFKTNLKIIYDCIRYIN